MNTINEMSQSTIWDQADMNRCPNLSIIYFYLLALEYGVLRKPVSNSCLVKGFSKDK